jgi:hypothetical protein
MNLLTDWNNYHFFDISVYQLNLFSFVLGMIYSFLHQGVFGKRIGILIILYFAGLSIWYAMLHKGII